VSAWVSFLNRVIDVCGETQLSASQVGEEDISWGKTATQVFKKSQPMTGFGAALGKLKGFGILKELTEIEALANQITLGSQDATEFLFSINKAMAWIKRNTKKIGSAQRAYFLYFFRELFNEATDSYLNLSASAESALHKVETQI